MSASRLVDAMEQSIVPHNSNPLKNKVVYADIRVQGIEDDTNRSVQDETSVQLVEQPTPSAEDVETQERAEEMQSWWNNGMKKHMNQPNGYTKVAVLSIKWDDELDKLKTKNEVCRAPDPKTQSLTTTYRPSSSMTSSETASTISLRLLSLMYRRNRSISSAVALVTSYATTTVPTIFLLYTTLAIASSTRIRSSLSFRPA
jgi:hypothetical protein